MARKTRTSAAKAYPRRAADVPVTQRMLFLVRDELKAETKAFEKRTLRGFEEQSGKFSGVDAKFKEIDARFAQIDERFKQVDARFEQVDQRFKEVDARFERLESKVDSGFREMRLLIEEQGAGFSSELHQMRLLIEEQNARNNIVLDGLTNLFHRQERVEQRVDGIEKVLLDQK